ncbi:MAG: TonB-dependent receptor domain-containing protein, partial [Terriglobia bacterium]
IRNVATGVSRRIESNALGRYSAAALPAGNYEVSVSLAGFQTLVRSGIELTVGRNAVVDLALQVGEVTQAITITGEASHVETTTATVSNLVDEKRVLEIPLNNRDLTQLAYFQPGVLKVPQQGNYDYGNAFVGGLGDKLSVGGARGSQNVYLLDGVSNADHSGNAQSTSGSYSGAETVEEFQIITNNYSAEYPSKPGAIVSAVTKSGTNAFHGSLYEFLRNDNLDAFKWEDKIIPDVVPEKPEFKRNNFGGSLGGPIMRDRTFFFGSYEGLRERISVSRTLDVPTADGRLGILGRNPDGTPKRLPVPVAPQVRPYLNVWPLPGERGHNLITDYNDGRALVGATQRNGINDDFATIKVDHQFASQRKGFLAFTYSFSDGNRDVFAPLSSDANLFYLSRRHVISARHTSILSPTMLNEFVFGHTRTASTEDIQLDYDFQNVNGANLVFVPEKTTMGVIDVADIAGIGDFFDERGETNRTRVFTFKDSVSLTRPSHTIKFGGEINYSRYPYRDSARTAGGFAFLSLEDFLTAKPRSFRIAVPAGVPVLGEPVQRIYDWDVRQSTFGFFLQDNWKVRPSLTLNLGLRYEFQTLPQEANNNWYALRNLTDTRLTRGQAFTNPTLRDFSPRIGFAWAPGSQTSLRGGFGIYYDLLGLYHYEFSTSHMPPASAETTILDTDAIAAGATGLNFP